MNAGVFKSEQFFWKSCLSDIEFKKRLLFFFFRQITKLCDLYKL